MVREMVYFHIQSVGTYGKSTFCCCWMVVSPPRGVKFLLLLFFDIPPPNHEDRGGRERATPLQSVKMKVQPLHLTFSRSGATGFSMAFDWRRTVAVCSQYSLVKTDYLNWAVPFLVLWLEGEGFCWNFFCLHPLAFPDCWLLQLQVWNI